MNAINALLDQIIVLYRRVLNSIAFYPIIITLGFFLLSILITSDIGQRLSGELIDYMPALAIEDTEIAETILSTLIGGILSLTVFSFSMVMVVLSQASSDFSPRLLPGLVSDRRHQIILGIYTGTLLFCLVILIKMGVSIQEKDTIGLSAMIAAILGVTCVILFVYFIHNISKAIQIDTIIDETYFEGKSRLQVYLDNQKEAERGGEDWETYPSRRTGYFRGLKSNFRLSDEEMQDLSIELVPFIDQYTWEGMPLFRVSQAIDEDWTDRIYDAMEFLPDRHEGNEYLGAMIKLMEVAVKAMSPGINDPGTAIDALVKLSDLMCMALEVYDVTYHKDESTTATIIINNIQAKELFRILLQPIRHYSKDDVSVLHVLINCLRSMSGRFEHSDAIMKEIDLELAAIEEQLENTELPRKDRNLILEELKFRKKDVSKPLGFNA